MINLDSLLAQQARCRATTRRDGDDYCQRSCARCDRCKAWRHEKSQP